MASSLLKGESKVDAEKFAVYASFACGNASVVRTFSKHFSFIIPHMRDAEAMCWLIFGLAGMTN